jgi:hypothetical protein
MISVNRQNRRLSAGMSCVEGVGGPILPEDGQDQHHKRQLMALLLPRIAARLVLPQMTISLIIWRIMMASSVHGYMGGILRATGRDMNVCKMTRPHPWSQFADTPPRATRRRSTPLVPTLHQGFLVQGLNQADEGSTDDTGHMPASAEEAARPASPARSGIATAPSPRAWPRRDTSAHGASSTCRITRRISRALNGLTTCGRWTCVKKAWASGLNTSPVRKMTRDTRCGWRRSSSR